MTKEEAVAEIDRLKREKPDKWKLKVRNIVWHLWYLDHPHLPEHTDEYGRHNSTRRFSDCPNYDPMDDESEP